MISIIMPSLNVEKYIRGCVESVINQSFSDLEILCIDAGSSDGTLDILREFERKDSRVKVIVSNKKSYGYQMNTGLAMAQGEYVGIVETDDYISANMYEKLWSEAKKSGAEIVKLAACGFIELLHGTEFSFEVTNPLRGSVMVGEVIAPKNMPELLIKDNFHWSGIYKKDFLKGILFNDTPGAAYQDQGFLLQTLSKANKAVYLDAYGYHYRMDNNTASSHNTNGIRFINHEYELNIKHLDTLSRTWRDYFWARFFDQILGRFDQMTIEGEYWYMASADIERSREMLKEALDESSSIIECIEAMRRRYLYEFLNNPIDLFFTRMNENKKNKDEIERIRTFIGTTPNIVVFGSGTRGKSVIAFILKNFPLVRVIPTDNNNNLWNEEILGLRIHSPKEISDIANGTKYIIANKDSSKEIEEQLSSYHVLEGDILVMRCSIPYAYM